MDHPKGRFDAARAVWHRASGAPGESDDGQIEVAFVDDLIGLRSSKDPDGAVLVFTRDEWDAFVGGARDGEFDVG